MVKWDNGRTLNLLPTEDKFHKIDQNQTEKVAETEELEETEEKNMSM